MTGRGQRLDGGGPRADVAGVESREIRVGGVVVQLGRHRARVGGRWVGLSPNEAALIGRLADSAETVDRGELLGVLGFRPGARTRAVDHAIARLRKKLGRDVIVSVRGAGYRLAVPERVAPSGPGDPGGWEGLFGRDPSRALPLVERGPLCVCGPLGVGKSAFLRALARHAGLDEADVQDDRDRGGPPARLVSQRRPSPGIAALRLEPLPDEPLRALLRENRPPDVPQAELEALVVPSLGLPLVALWLLESLALLGRESLQQRLARDPLSVLRGTRPSRHASMDAAIAWSPPTPAERSLILSPDLDADAVAHLVAAGWMVRSSRGFQLLPGLRDWCAGG